MERRKFVIGLGALASGSAAAVGTGAVSPGTRFERNADVAVAETDNGAIIALKEGSGDSDLVSYDQNGRLNIDLGPGVNPDSEYKIGTGSDPAFRIQNNDPDSQIIAFDFDPDNYTDLLNGDSDTFINFNFFGVADSVRGNNFAMWLSSGAGQDPEYNTYFEIPSGNAVDVTMSVKPGKEAGGEDLTGQMEFEVVEEIPESVDYK